MAETLELEDLLQESFNAQALGLWTTLPATVVSFDGGTMGVPPTATLQPFPSDYAGGDPVPLPQLSCVPVCFPYGQRSDLATGTVVLVHFASRSLERWRGAGDTGDPQSYRHHNLSDGFCVPMDASLTAPAVGTAPKAARVGDDVSVSVPADWIAFVTAVGTALGIPKPTSTAFTGTITSGSDITEID